MQGYLKELRYPISGLVILLVATVAVLIQRHQMKRATERLEVCFIAVTIFDANLASLSFKGADVTGLPNDDNQGSSPSTAQQAIEDSKTLFETVVRKYQPARAIDALGFLSEALPGKMRSQFEFSGVGWLGVETSRADEGVFNADPRNKGSQGANNASAGGLYFLYVEMKKLAEEENTTAGSAIKFVFNNVAMEEDKNDWTISHRVPGKIVVQWWDVSTNTWKGPMDREQMNAVGLQFARSQGVSNDDLRMAYFELRSMYERQEVGLPLLDVNISAAWFLSSAFFISISLAAWTSFLLGRLHGRVPQNVDEPWILVEPYFRVSSSPPGRRIIVWSEVLLFALFHVTAFATPMILGVIATSTASGWWRWMHLLPLAIAAVFTYSMFQSYRIMVRSALKQGREKRQVEKCHVEKKPSDSTAVAG